MKSKANLQKTLLKQRLLKAAKTSVKNTHGFASIIKQLSLKIVYPQAAGFEMNLLQTINYQQHKAAYTVIKQDVLIPKLKRLQASARKPFKKTTSPLRRSGNQVN